MALEVIGHRLVNLPFKIKPHRAFVLWGFFMSELLAVVAGVFLEMGQKWENFIFRHKKRTRLTPKSLILMVAIGGFEPPTPGL